MVGKYSICIHHICFIHFICWSTQVINTFLLLWITYEIWCTNICLSSTFNYFKCIPRGRISGSYSSSMLSFLETINYFPQWLHRFIFLPTMYEDRNFSTSLPALFIYCIVAFLVDMKWYLIVVLIYISLMTNDVECLFVCLSKLSFPKYILTHTLCLDLIDTVFVKLYTWCPSKSVSVLPQG